MPKGRTRRDRRAELVPGSGPLARVRPAVAFLTVVAVFGLGVWLRGPLGAILLGLLAAGVGVLLATAWPRLTPPERGLRLAVLAVLVVVAVSVLR